MASSQSTIITVLNELCDRCYETSAGHGFWEDYNKLEAVIAADYPTLVEPLRQMMIGQKLALIHSETSEILEGVRHGNPPDDHIPEFTAAEAEAADILIRVFDLSKRLNLRLGLAVLSKMQYNESRPYKHGKLS